MRSEYIAKTIRKYIGIVFLCLILSLLTTYSLCAPKFWAQRELESNRAKWSSQKITHYRFDLEIRCFCPYAFVPVTIEVDGQIISMTDEKGIVQEDYIAERFLNLGTIERLFDGIQKGINGADLVLTEYDGRYGFPTSFKIDWKQRTYDDEFTYTITNFEVLP